VETAADTAVSGKEDAVFFGGDCSEEQATSTTGNSPIAKIWSFKIRFSQSRASGPDMLTRRVATDPTIQKQLRSESEIFKTELFKNWTRKNHAKFEYKNNQLLIRFCGDTLYLSQEEAKELFLFLALQTDIEELIDKETEG